MGIKLKKEKSNCLQKQFLPLRPDKTDNRDYSAIAFGISWWTPRLPKIVDYSRQTLPVGNQGNTGACVGWSTSYLRSWLQYKLKGKKVRYSVRFIWLASKEIDQIEINVPFDSSGTYIRDAMKVMKKYGSAPDKLWPFRSQLPDSSKEKRIKDYAIKNRIGNYYSLRNNDERRQHLAKKGPFVVGVPVYTNWSNISSNGIVPLPGGAFRGGHAILVVGYDDKKKLFKFQNSWSTSWGKRGFGYFTYDYMENYAWNSWGADRL